MMTRLAKATLLLVYFWLVRTEAFAGSHGRGVTTLTTSPSLLPALFAQPPENEGENVREMEVKRELPSPVKKKRPKKVLTQEENDRAVMNRLLIFQRLDGLTYFVGIGIILFSCILNIFGYAYVVDERGLRIDTLEARQFQDEIVRDQKSFRR